jgi:LacI family transcriptional regulator
MRDVAALAGVSLKTVSRVINREAGVSPEVVARVDDAAAQLDFRPDMNASNLRRNDGRTGTIGLLLEDVANEFSAAAHAGVEYVARKLGISVLASSTNEDRERERSLVRALSSRRVDGLIIAPSPGDHDYLVAEVAQGVPIVFIDRAGRGLAAPAVLSDNMIGARRGVEKLIELGHRRIAFVGGTATLVTAQQRYQGFFDAMARAGIGVDSTLVHLDASSAEKSAAIVRSLVAREDRPSAIFSAQNMITIGAVRALREFDLQHRIALIGFDDFTLADLLDPGVAVVAQDPRTIGQRAAELLFSMMADPASARTSLADVIVPTTLIMRPSGEIRPA